MANGQYFTSNTFWPTFDPDLAGTKNSVIFVCPYLERDRVENMEPRLCALRDHGIAMFLLMREPAWWWTQPSELTDAQKEERAEIESLQALLAQSGVYCEMRDWIHQKFCIIDRQIIWSGSLNIFSHTKSKDQMHRAVSKACAKDVITDHGLLALSYPRASKENHLRIRQAIGLFLRKRRNEKGLTQCQLAALLGSTQYFISKVESGKTPLKWATLKKLAIALDFEISFERDDKRVAGAPPGGKENKVTVESLFAKQREALGLGVRTAARLSGRTCWEVSAIESDIAKVPVDAVIVLGKSIEMTVFYSFPNTNNYYQLGMLE
jgi:transcriptional regulator with XRE-family HTH domain